MSRSKCSDITLAELEDKSIGDQCCSLNGSHGKLLLTVRYVQRTRDPGL